MTHSNAPYIQYIRCHASNGVHRIRNSCQIQFSRIEYFHYFYSFSLLSQSTTFIVVVFSCFSVIAPVIFQRHNSRTTFVEHVLDEKPNSVQSGLQSAYNTTIIAGQTMFPLQEVSLSLCADIFFPFE